MEVREIKDAISRLAPGDLADLSSWFADYYHQKWDEQIERDLESGRLDGTIAEAEKEYEAGRSKPL